MDTYSDPTQLLDLFARMQEVQIRYAADSTRPGYRRRAYRSPEVRLAAEQEKRTRASSRSVRDGAKAHE